MLQGHNCFLALKFALSIEMHFPRENAKSIAKDLSSGTTAKTLELGSSYVLGA